MTTLTTNTNLIPLFFEMIPTIILTPKMRCKTEYIHNFDLQENIVNY